ncbi:MAG: deoxynucleoside kinase [Candidatus Marinimicrobia bacterium]|nr:deoxynucleoside kinase [Candidatus Neomarinimicrobiota bacterium]
MEKCMNEFPHIGIAGNIGVGKTTLCEKLSEVFSLQPIYESVIDNPYLEDFYSDMERWSFNLQIYFLYHRFSNQVKLSNMKKGFIQDRTIYEDREIFARNLKDSGYMSERDWNTYSELFNNMTSFINEPNLIIYLKANTDTLLTRIENRNRIYEAKISPEYIHSLNVYYNKWISSLEPENVLIIDTNNFNIFKDFDMLEEIINLIKKKIV